MTTLSLIIDSTVKVTVMLVVALLVGAALRRASASLRAALWSATFGALLALPMLIWTLPTWRTPLMPEPRWTAAVRSGNESESTRAATSPARIRRVQSPLPAPIPEASAIETQPALPDEPAGAARLLHLSALIPAAWLTGFVLVFCWYLIGQVRAWRMFRRARLQSPSWSALLEEMHLRLEMRRYARIRYSDEVNVPLTWGVARDVILVPAHADSWTSTQRESVLLHELAHVRRRDCLLQMVTQFTCALYWFHPLVWYAASRLRIERERACDDTVLTAGGDPHDYAAHLVRLAREARRLPSGAIAMARTSQLEGRLLSILDQHIDRRSTSESALLRLTIAALLLVAPLASIRPLRAAPEPGRQASRENALPLHQPIVTRQAPLESATQRPVENAPAAPAIRAAAESIVVAPNLSAPFAERWGWALREGARRGGDVWIAYGIVTGDARTQGMISDSESISLDAQLTRGTALGRLLRDASGADPGDNVIVFLMRQGSPEPRRVRVRSTRFNMQLESRPLFWLGTVSDAESVPHLRSLFERASGDRIRETLVGGIAIHDTEGLVIPFLEQVIGSNASDDVREQAIEGLGFHDGDESIRLLAQLAREDRSPNLREEAAETIGMLRRGDAADSLVKLVRTASAVDVRLEAAEAIGELDDSRVEAILEELAFSDNEIDVLREVAETLGDLDGARGMAQLEKIVRTHGRSEVRAEAVESLASKPERVVLPLLRRTAFEDSSERVQSEAIETLGEIQSGAAREILREIIARHPRAKMRAEAVEKLGDDR